jgi:hypothetical protein
MAPFTMIVSASAAPADTPFRCEAAERCWCTSIPFHIAEIFPFAAGTLSGYTLVGLLARFKLRHR